jgi:2-oxoglutarate ferredoxin oxidoreductase subunit gamma
MTEKIIIAGEGGQGIMLLGRILAETALRKNKNTTWFPSYGAEVRGGTAFCMVTISDNEISSPYIDFADTLMVMNEQSLERFKDRVKDKGLLLINSSLIRRRIKRKNLKILNIPFTQIASKLGDIRCTNMVALGCYLKKKPIFSLKDIFPILKENFSEEILKLNEKAIREGLRYC